MQKKLAALKAVRRNLLLRVRGFTLGQLYMQRWRLSVDSVACTCKVRIVVAVVRRYVTTTPLLFFSTGLTTAGIYH